ncbi:hypothetical protein PSN45_000130 [Yamadazyma tenuis]|nr:hypothetical protein PSN45_000130 [Yamadazyma tenuis]
MPSTASTPLSTPISGSASSSGDFQRNFITSGSPIRNSTVNRFLVSPDPPESDDELRAWSGTIPGTRAEVVAKLAQNLAVLKRLKLTPTPHHVAQNFSKLSLIMSYFQIVNQLEQLNHSIDLHNLKTSICLKSCVGLLAALDAPQTTDAVPVASANINADLSFDSF